MKLTLNNRKVEVDNVETLFFESREPLIWQPGQFLHYVLHHEPTDDRGSDRWFTNSAAPFENIVRITTRFNDEKSSSFKKALRGLKIGEEIEISDVDGDFTMNDPNQEYVFIAGGIGITPFRAILKQLDHESKPIKIILLYSNRDQNVPFRQELEEIAKKNSEFKIHYITSPERINEQKIKEVVKDIQKPIFYVSGPEPMVEALGKSLLAMDVSEDHIKQDWFPGYLEV